MSPGDQGTPPIASLSGVHKRFGPVTALAGIDLEIRPGEIVALLGANGAGKTTAVSIFLGLRTPDEGTATLFGGDPRLPSSRQRIGATPQDTGFPQHSTVKEVITLVQAHYRRPAALPELLRRFDLLDLLDRQTGGLSGGQQRRLALALAFAGNPEAVFLDEPTTGLDPVMRRAVWQQIADFAKQGGAVFLTSHYMEEAEQLASRVVLIGKGRILRQGSIKDIKAVIGVRRISYSGPAIDPLGPEFRTVVESAECIDGRQLLYSRDADGLVRALVRADIAFSDLEVAPVSLEDAMISVLAADEGPNLKANLELGS